MSGLGLRHVGPISKSNKFSHNLSNQFRAAVTSLKTGDIGSIYVCVYIYTHTHTHTHIYACEQTRIQ
jgi:hypothetical protein